MSYAIVGFGKIGQALAPGRVNNITVAVQAPAVMQQRQFATQRSEGKSFYVPQPSGNGQERRVAKALVAAAELIQGGEWVRPVVSSKLEDVLV